MATPAVQIADRRVPLSRERVLRAAIGLADQGGIEALSMRKLAQELGVEAMSLYYYAANKDDILDGMLDIVLGEFEAPSGGADWRAEIRRSAISAHHVLMRHRWACSLMLSPGRVRPAQVRRMESLLRPLREAGFSAEMTDHAYHALESHIMGFTLWLAGMSLDKLDLKKLAETFLLQFPADEYPYLHEHAQQHFTRPKGEGGSAFAFGLDLILDGLEKIRETASARSVSTRRRTDGRTRGSGHPRRRAG